MLDSLKVLTAVEKEKDEIARMAEELCERFQNNLPKRAQFENLRLVASSTESIEELKSFIYYQKARKIPKWTDKFVEELIKKIEGIKSKFSDNKQMQIKAIRLFTGYLIRYALFYSKEVR
jgi:phage regulator Rha-like protein